MRLSALLHAAQISNPIYSANAADVDPEIKGVEDDSRRVLPGYLFVARRGEKSDGSEFANSAVAQGAAAIVSETPIELAHDGIAVPVVIVEDAGRAVGALAHAFFGRPSEQISLIGITGTSGKTTCAYLVRHLLNFAGKKCGMVGTIEIDDGSGAPVPAELTTPGAAELVAILARARDNGCEALVMETSSHALSQDRVSSLHFSAAGYTNLSQDHLDYHKTFDAYAAAKAKLFEMLDESGVAVVNGQDEHTFRMVQNCRGVVKTFAVEHLADYRAVDVQITSGGSNFLLLTPGASQAVGEQAGQASVRMKLVGKHNIQNALLAAGIVIERFGISVDVVAQGLSAAPSIPGRLQVVDKQQDFAVLVDYAHKPDALENVLNAMRPLTKGRLRVVFGCGGNRDRGKRPIMAQIAQNLADHVYITSDNPRDEHPSQIIEEICTGLQADSSSSVTIEPNRRRAIEKAVADSEAGDVLIVAGKGHEDYQIVKGAKTHFDDVKECERALLKKTGRVG